MKGSELSMKEVIPFLMFQGQAKEALELYTSVIEDSEIISISYYEANEGAQEGTVKSALLRIHTNHYYVNDSPIQHEFTFTPSFSFFITANNTIEQHELFNQLKRGGAILMPLDTYGFSRSFGWCVDRFGVSWQISVE